MESRVKVSDGEVWWDTHSAIWQSCLGRVVLVCNWLEAIDSEAEEASVVCSG